MSLSQLSVKLDWARRIHTTFTVNLTQVAHRWSAVGTVPWRLQSRQIPYYFIHLLETKCVTNHNAFATGSWSQHMVNFFWSHLFVDELLRRSRNLERVKIVLYSVYKLVEVFFTENSILRHGQRFEEPAVPTLLKFEPVELKKFSVLAHCEFFCNPHLQSYWLNQILSLNLGITWERFEVKLFITGMLVKNKQVTV